MILTTPNYDTVQTSHEVQERNDTIENLRVWNNGQKSYKAKCILCWV